MKQFVFQGKYTTYRGYVFAHGKPTTITDRGTLTDIARNPMFREVTEAPEPVVADPYDCPKCGKNVKQGHYMHVKWCKG